MKLLISNSISHFELELFKNAYKDSISKLYPYSTVKSAQSIINKHVAGYDEDGYFTTRKTIWKAQLENNEVAAFTVITEKRGGSIKFGPTIVLESKRNIGVGSHFRILVEDEYSNRGYRKAYSTTNLSNIPAISYITKIGYKIELHLKQHYSLKSDELVLSKVIDKKNKISFENKIDIEQIKGIPQFVVDYLTAYYDDIDNRFFMNMLNAITEVYEYDEDFFIKKKKHQYYFENQYAIVTPKRGGCAKIFPLILSENPFKANSFMEYILSHYRDSLLHKYYTLVPMDRFNDIKRLKDLGFIIEGLIIEPYKRGVDLILLSLIKP